MTYGFSGADLALMYNHAAMLAAERAGAQNVSVNDGVLPPHSGMRLEDIVKAIDFVQFGDEKVSRQNEMRMKDKVNTTVHELCGHAIVADVLKDYVDPVGKVTIMRHSKYAGFVSLRPDHDRVNMTREEALARIIVVMAGRAAQEHFLGVADSGASGDFQQATDMAREMVMNWGMSTLGRIAVGVRSDGQQIRIAPPWPIGLTLKCRG